MLNALKADARTVDLRALAGWFYGGVARVLELFEEEEIGDLVAEVCFVFFIFLRGWGGGEDDWHFMKMRFLTFSSSSTFFFFFFLIQKKKIVFQETSGRNRRSCA